MDKLTFPKFTSDSCLEKASGVYESLRRTRPTTRGDLKNYVKVFLGIDIPDKRICPEHNSPMDYLWHSFWADFTDEKPANADAIIWANRSGGKTELAAVATLLDCTFKPNCQVRILAGSGEQAGRMYEYLTGFLKGGFEEFLAGPVRKGKCSFVNGSAVEVLTQSPMSVSGPGGGKTVDESPYYTFWPKGIIRIHKLNESIIRYNFLQVKRL